MHHRRLTVEFRGIAVHFNSSENPELGLPYPHRVVIPHRDTPLCWNGNEIAVHEPFLRTDLDLPCLPRYTRDRYWLRGVTFQVQSTAALIGIQRKVECFPKLKTMWKNMEIDEAVVTGRRTPAAAYFDSSNGFIEAVEHRGSAAAKLTIEFETDTAVLAIDCWDGESHLIDVDLPARLIFEHTGKSQQDGLNDFVLDFLVARNFPPPPTISLSELDHVSACIRSSGTGELGPGCSNSQYP